MVHFAGWKRVEWLSSAFRLLEDQTSVFGQPLGVTRDTSEASRDTLFASDGRVETSYSDLVECAIVVNKA